MIQCKAAIKPHLVTVCLSVVTAESHFIADVYQIFEQRLLSHSSLPRVVFQPYPWWCLYWLYLGKSISNLKFKPLKPFYACSKNSNKVSSLGSICVDLVDICQKWRGLLTCLHCIRELRQLSTGCGLFDISFCWLSGNLWRVFKLCF